MFNFITLKPFNLDTKYITDIQEIIEKVITEKKDEYWKNYKDYSIFDQTMITVSLVNDKVKTFSSIYTRSFYDNDVYYSSYDNTRGTLAQAHAQGASGGIWGL